MLAAWALGRIAAPWPAWLALLIAILVIWTVPIWLRHEATALSSSDDFQQRLRAGRISLLHFYSDF